MTEITRYNLENILHDEKMKEIKKRTEKIQKKLRNRKAEDEKIFKHKGMNMTEVARKYMPVRSKVLDFTDKTDNTVYAHAQGYMHGMYLRVSAIALLWLVYVFL